MSVVAADGSGTSAQATEQKIRRNVFCAGDAYWFSGDLLRCDDDGYCWFVDRIDGDPSSVVGIGLPTVRELLAAVGVDVTALWRHAGPTT